MKELEFYFEIRPQAHQSVRTGRGGFFQPKKITDFKNNIQAMALSKLPDGFKMWGKKVPLIMSVRYCFRYRLREKHELIGSMIPKITKPDVTDNLNKALVDSMAGIVFEQDQQIFRLNAVKYWWQEDSIYIKFETV